MRSQSGNRWNVESSKDYFGLWEPNSDGQKVGSFGVCKMDGGVGFAHQGEGRERVLQAGGTM